MEDMVSRTLSVHKEHELLLKLESAGLSEDLVQRVIGSKDNELAEKIVRLVRNNGIKPSTSQKRARRIMGKNFFGIEEAIKYFGINPTQRQLVALSQIPFCKEVLERSKETHVLVVVFPLSILEIRGKSHTGMFRDDQTWFNDESFAKEPGEIGWQLVCKTSIGSASEANWNKETKILLGDDNEVPIAQVVVYTIVGHYLATGERLFEEYCVQTKSIDSDYMRVYVGNFDRRGLFIHGAREPRIAMGVASARKF